jgi:hypothetical protein
MTRAATEAMGPMANRILGDQISAARLNAAMHFRRQSSRNLSCGLAEKF